VERFTERKICIFWTEALPTHHRHTAIPVKAWGLLLLLALAALSSQPPMFKAKIGLPVYPLALSGQVMPSAMAEQAIPIVSLHRNGHRRNRVL